MIKPDAVVHGALWSDYSEGWDGIAVNTCTPPGSPPHTPSLQALRMLFLE